MCVCICVCQVWYICVEWNRSKLWLEKNRKKEFLQRNINISSWYRFAKRKVGNKRQKERKKEKKKYQDRSFFFSFLVFNKESPWKNIISSNLQGEFLLWDLRFQKDGRVGRFHVRDQRQRFSEFFPAEAAIHPVPLHPAIILLVSSKAVEAREAFPALLADHALRCLLTLLRLRQFVAAGNELEQRLGHLVLVLLLHEPIAQVRPFLCGTTNASC